MLHRICVYRMYVQEGLPWIWVHIYSVCALLPLIVQCWQLIEKVAYCHEHKS